MDFIAFEDQPISVMLGFQSLMEYTEPHYTPPNRHHFADICLLIHIHELLAREHPCHQFYI